LCHVLQVFGDSMSNPYQPLQFAQPLTAPFAPGIDREKLRRVAKYQQWVIYALLANIIMNVVGLAGGQAELPVRMGILVVALAVAVCAMVSIFLLANELYNVGIGVLCAIVMIIPCIALITLLIVNGKATGFLQQHGVKVGFMGANPNSI
jgi:hypothetical protein